MKNLKEYILLGIIIAWLMTILLAFVLDTMPIVSHVTINHILYVWLIEFFVIIGYCIFVYDKPVKRV